MKKVKEIYTSLIEHELRFPITTMTFEHKSNKQKHKKQENFHTFFYWSFSRIQLMLSLLKLKEGHERIIHNLPSIYPHNKIGVGIVVFVLKDKLVSIVVFERI